MTVKTLKTTCSLLKNDMQNMQYTWRCGCLNKWREGRHNFFLLAADSTSSCMERYKISQELVKRMRGVRILIEVGRIYISLWNMNWRILFHTDIFDLIHYVIVVMQQKTMKRELPWDIKVCFVVYNLQAYWKFCPRLDCQHVASDVASPSVWWECGLNWL